MLVAFAALVFAGLPAAFIGADVANVRALPSEDALIVQQLPIDAPVTIISSQHAWTQIEAALPSGTTVHGFVKAELISAARINVAATKVQVRGLIEASLFRDARRLAERAWAAAPGDPAAGALLIEVLTKSGDAHAADTINRTMQGTAPVFIGFCDGTHAIFFIELRAGERPVSTLECSADVSDPRQPGAAIPIPTDARRLARAFQVAPWFSLASDGSTSRVGALDFAGAHLEPARDDDEVGGIVARARIVLGTCTDNGAIFSTAPLAPYAPAPVVASDNRLGADELEQLLRAHEPFRESPAFVGATKETRDAVAPAVSAEQLQMSIEPPVVALLQRDTSKRVTFVDVLKRDPAALPWHRRSVAHFGLLPTTAEGEGAQSVTMVRFGAFAFGGRPFLFVTTDTADPSGGGWAHVALVLVERDDVIAVANCALWMRVGC